MPNSRYDKNGDIVILTEEVIETKSADVQTMTRLSRSAVQWAVQEERPAVHSQTISHIPSKNTKSVRAEPPKKSTSEIASQVDATVRSTGKLFSEINNAMLSLPKNSKAMMQKAWNVASMPVTLRGKRKQKTRTKAQLFFIDTLRFGGTFAGIFVVLFVGMNANSFWEIARAQLALNVDTETSEALQGLDKNHSSIEGMIPSQSREFGAMNILQYLPEVGPATDVLVIPKIGKIVPIVQPSKKSLLAGKWKEFEEDIQTALQDGVVHYPGSAKPGQAGNVFFTGHSSYYSWAKGAYKEVFALLHELDIGDTYFLYSNGDKHTYRIVKKYEVKPTDVSVLDQPTNKRLSTLMTCTPVGTTLRRLIVQAEEIDPVTGHPLAVGQKIAANENASLFTGLSALPI